jgi:hypothetical protein
MIIAINGDLVDVTKIYSISDIFHTDGYVHKFEPITEVEFDFAFTILFLNGPERKIRIKRRFEMNIADINCRYTELDTFKFFYNEFSEFRNDIINVWSKNQSTIPQFNLE